MTDLGGARGGHVVSACQKEVVFCSLRSSIERECLFSLRFLDGKSTQAELPR